MFWGKSKKEEKKRGIGGIFSLLGGALLLAGFFLPLGGGGKITTIGNLSLDPASMLSLFALAQQQTLFYLFALLALGAIFVGAYLYTLAFTNLIIASIVIYLLFIGSPLSSVRGQLLQSPGLGTILLCLGALFTGLGGFLTTKRNLWGESQKGKKKKKEKKKKRKPR